MNNVIWNSSSLITPSAKSSKKESKTSREGKKKNDVDLWSFVDNADPLGRKVRIVRTYDSLVCIVDIYVYISCRPSYFLSIIIKYVSSCLK